MASPQNCLLCFRCTIMSRVLERIYIVQVILKLYIVCTQSAACCKNVIVYLFCYRVHVSCICAI